MWWQPIPIWHLIAQSQQQKYQKNVWNLLKFSRSVVFIVNFEQISHIFLMFLLLTWNK